MILLITSKEDVTTDLVVDNLNLSDAEYYRFNTESLGETIDILFEPQSWNVILFDKCKDIPIDLSTIKSVYYRRPKIPRPPSDLVLSEQQFVINETASTLEGIYKYLDDKFWVSNVFAIRQAENKLYQQLIASHFGLVTPRSIVTNNHSKILEFLGAHGECILKPIRSGFVGDDFNPKVIFTSLITTNDISSLERVNECPTYLQEHIVKVADVRVTVVGSSVFSAKIYSQATEDTRIDWRKGENINLKYEAFDLGPALNEACIKLTRHLGLQFGALDFVLDKKGNYIFLEINPNGQWGWIQYRLNYDISGTISKLLISQAQ